MAHLYAGSRHRYKATAMALLLCALALAVRAGAAAAPQRCTLQVILVMEPPAAQRPSEAVVAQLARAARVALSFVRDAGTGSYVFRLSARGGPDQCQKGLERLRSDGRVKSAEVDARRQAAGRSLGL